MYLDCWIRTLVLMLDIDHVFEALQNHIHCISILIFSHESFT